MNLIPVSSKINFLLRFGKNKEIEMNQDTDIDTIRDLKLIGKLKEGEKILITYRIVRHDSLLTSLERTWYKETRDMTLKFVRNTINRAFDMLELNRGKSGEYDKKQNENIIQDLRDSLIGITNLKETYENDTSFGCSMDALYQQIEAKLITYQEKPKDSASKNNLKI